MRNVHQWAIQVSIQSSEVLGLGTEQEWKQSKEMGHAPCTGRLYL